MNDTRNEIFLEDNNKYCDDYRVNYAISQSFIYLSAFVIVLINMAIVWLFTTCSKFEKRETVNEEIQSKFIKMTIV